MNLHLLLIYFLTLCLAIMALAEGPVDAGFGSDGGIGASGCGHPDAGMAR